MRLKFFLYSNLNFVQVKFMTHQLLFSLDVSLSFGVYLPRVWVQMKTCCKNSFSPAHGWNCTISGSPTIAVSITLFRFNHKFNPSWCHFVVTHGNGHVILMIFSLLDALEIVILTISGAAIHGNFFHFSELVAPSAPPVTTKLLCWQFSHNLRWGKYVLTLHGNL